MSRFDLRTGAKGRARSVTAGKKFQGDAATSVQPGGAQGEVPAADAASATPQDGTTVRTATANRKRKDAGLDKRLRPRGIQAKSGRKQYLEMLAGEARRFGDGTGRSIEDCHSGGRAPRMQPPPAHSWQPRIDLPVPRTRSLRTSRGKCDRELRVQKRHRIIELPVVLGFRSS